MQCANSIFSPVSKKSRIKLEKVRMVYNSLSLSLPVDSTVIDVYYEICQVLVEMTSYPLLSPIVKNDAIKPGEELPEEIVCTLFFHVLLFNS